MLRFLRAAALTLAVVLAPLAAGAQSIIQSGNVTPGHAAMWTTSGILQDAGSSANGGLTSLGLTNPNLCSFGINSASITLPYVQLCLGVSPNQGAAQLVIQGLGGATTPPFSIVDSAGMIPPIWTTSTRPPAPTAGVFGFNTTIADLEVYTGTIWFPLGDIYSVATGQTAAGSSCTGAFQMTAIANTFTTVPASSAALLPAVPVGTEVLVFNRGANTLLLCPGSAAIENNPSGFGVQLAVGGSAKLFLESATEWRVE